MRKIISLILILLFPANLLFAGKEVLTLEEAVREVLSGNPDIQAAGYRSEEARARVSQVKALEDPQVGVEFYNVPIHTADVTKADDIDYRIEQRLPFPGKRYVKGKAARLDAQAIAETNRGNIQDVLLDLKRTYYNIYRIDRSLEVNHQNQGLLRQFLGSAETAYASGKITADGPLKARVESSILKNEGIILDQERTTHMAHLKALLNHPSHGDVRLPSRLNWPRLKVSLEEAKSTALQGRPELRAIDAMERRDRAKLTSARQGLIPDFSLGLAYKQRPNQGDVWAGTAMINLPIFFWGKNRGEIREAKASLKATEAEQKSMHLHTQHEIEQAYSAVRSAEKSLGLYQREILPSARTTLNIARESYGSGRVDFLTLIDAARTYKDLQFAYFENQARLGTSFAELERLIGNGVEK